MLSVAVGSLKQGPVNVGSQVHMPEAPSSEQSRSSGMADNEVIGFVGCVLVLRSSSFGDIQAHPGGMQSRLHRGLLYAIRSRLAALIGGDRSLTTAPRPAARTLLDAFPQ